MRIDCYLSFDCASEEALNPKNAVKIYYDLKSALHEEERMNLQEKLNSIKAGFEASAPQDAVDIMHRAVDDLRKSGILEHVLKVGDRAPDFRLHNAEGKGVNSEEILARRPLVISFYRGKW